MDGAADGGGTEAGTDGLPVRERWLAFLTVATSISLAVLDGAIVNVALPVVARDVGASPAEVIWVVTAYQLAIVASLLPFSSLGDGHGYRRVYLAGLVLFTVASLGCAFAPSLPVLAAARAVQGLGAAGVMSVNMALVRFIFPQRFLGRGIGMMALSVAVASAAGPTIAAAILSVATWPWLFLVNVPFGTLAFLIGLRTLPRTPASGRRFDVLSVLLNAATFGLLVTGVDAIGDGGSAPAALLRIGAGLVVGAVFVFYQIRLPDPLLPIDLLRRPVFALSVATSICSFCAQTVALLALPFHFHDDLGLGAAATGLLMTPWPLAIAVMAPISGRLTEHYPPGLLGGIGLAAMSLGLGLLALLPAAPAPADIVWRLTICGLGFSLFQTPNNRALITSAPRERSGGASGMQSSARLTGQSLGAAFVAVIFNLVAAPARTDAALWLAAGLAASGCLASSLRRTPPARLGA